MMKISKIVENLSNLIIAQINYGFIQFLEKKIRNCDTILDLGCGYQSPLGLIKKKKFSSVGVDIFEKYITISRKKKIHDNYITCNFMDIDNFVAPKSFDCVLLLEVIEHLDKIDAIKLLKKIEKIAIKRIIISSPNGFLSQEMYHNNIHQIHKSGWNQKFFKRLNYKVYGIGGLKLLRMERGEMKFKSIKAFTIIFLLSIFFMKYLPQLAFQLLAVKNLKIEKIRFS